jgi:hypothetical protein
VTISANKNITTDTIAGGRSYADGISYRVGAIGTNTVTGMSLPTGQYGSWKMDETADNSCAGGQDACDTSGNGNHGTATGTTIVDGKFSKARSFNGSSDYLELPVATSPTAYTIEAWVKAASGAVTSRSIICRTNSSGCTSAWSHQLRITSGGKFQHYTYDGGAKSVTGTTTVVADTWYHVAITAQNSSVIRLYVNGTEEGTATAIATLWTGGDRYRLGQNSGDSMSFFGGTVDELSLFHSVRTASQIADDAAAIGSIDGLTTGDDTLLINLQGDSTNNGNAGNYEILEVQSVSGNTITLTSNIQKIYGATTSNSDLTGQRIIVQRIPNYKNVTINNGVTLTASAWNGTSGGLVAFKASGTVNIYGSINVTGLGYRGGGGSSSAAVGGQNGESFDGYNGSGGTYSGNCGSNGGGRGRGSTSVCPAGNRGGGGGSGGTKSDQSDNGSGGGGGGGYGGGGGGGGGGGYSTGYSGGAGGNGGNTSVQGGGGGGGGDQNGANGGAAGSGGSSATGTGGAVGASDPSTGQGAGSGIGSGGGGGGGMYGVPDLSDIFLGSGGGASGTGSGGGGKSGGAGGGIVFIQGNTINIAGSISSAGNTGTSPAYPAGGGGNGSGGSILLRGSSVYIGNNLVTAPSTSGSGAERAGAGLGGGGVGRIRAEYITSFAGTSTPTVSSAQISASAYYSSATVQSTNLLSGISETINSIDEFVYNLSKPSGTTATVQFSQTGTTAATGGTITYSGDYTIHTFTSSGTLTVGEAMNVEVLVVAGGGGGGKAEQNLGGDGGGGGGAGGIVYNASYAVTPGEKTVTVGSGGAGATTYSGKGGTGENSVFDTITAYGGGGGGTDGGGYNPGADGGSGGGAANQYEGANSGGAASPSGQGNAGGGATTNYTTQRGGSGGGGASTAGTSRTSAAGGAGGNGTAYSISGSAMTYGGGGGGGGSNGSAGGSGGSGGGGAGGSNGNGANATANTGGGGGGGGAKASDGGNGGNGGSGIVIVRYIPSSSSSWYNSAGVPGGTDTLTTGANNSINLSTLGWSGANFYYKIAFAGDGSNTPVLSDVTVNYTVASSGSSCSPPNGGNFAISSNCSFPNTVDGVDNGNLTIKAGSTLTVNAGQTLARNPGKSIIIETGGSIAINTTGQIQQTYLWVDDPDGDKLATSLASQAAQDNSPGGTYIRRNTALGSAIGDARDGSITISSGTNLNTWNHTGRTCADGGDAVNYSVVSLGTNSVSLSSSVSSGCLTQGDQVLLINLQGTTNSSTNTGNWEILSVQSVSSSTVFFTTNKTKYYGDTSSSDENIGTGSSNQKVMLQRLPQYQDVTAISQTGLYPSAWNGTKGGVLAFKATGTVSLTSGTGTIKAAGSGYRGGSTGGVGVGGTGGESYTGYNGAGGNTNGAGSGGGGRGSNGGGTAGTTGTSGGGGGGGSTSSGCCSWGGGGGGGGGGYAGGGGGGGGGGGVQGYGSGPGGDGGATDVKGGGGGAGDTGESGGAGGNAGANGSNSQGDDSLGGAAASTNASTGQGGGAGGTGRGGGGGGGGGIYGTADLSKLFFGSGGGGASGEWGLQAGANGGGIILIIAGTIDASSGYALAVNGDSAPTAGQKSGTSGNGASGSILLKATTVTLGTGKVFSPSSTKTGQSYEGAGGGGGGAGRIAIGATTVTGTTNPTYTAISGP